MREMIRTEAVEVWKELLFHLNDHYRVALAPVYHQHRHRRHIFSHVVLRLPARCRPFHLITRQTFRYFIIVFVFVVVVCFVLYNTFVAIIIIIIIIVVCVFCLPSNFTRVFKSPHTWFHTVLSSHTFNVHDPKFFSPFPPFITYSKKIEREREREGKNLSS